MDAYRTVQAGPNNHGGGVHEGFASVGYQVATPAAVEKPPIAAAEKLASRKPARTHAERSVAMPGR